VAELIAGMFSGSRYKRSQGRIARQVTFFAILATVVIGVWQLSAGSTGDLFARFMTVEKARIVAQYVVPSLLAVLGAWAAFRIVNIPRFADFLISVEAEMNKVSWPSRAELFRASMVVIVVIFMLTAILFTYDLVLKFVIGKFLGGPAE